MRLPPRTTLRLGGTVAVWLLATAWVLLAHPWSGRTVFTITGTHGVHRHDVLGVAVAVIVTTALWSPPTRTR